MNNIVGVLMVLLAAFSALQVEANYRRLNDYDGAALLPPHQRCSSHSSQDPIVAVAALILDPITSTFTPHHHVKGQYSQIQLLPFPVGPLNIVQPFTQLQQTLSHPSLFGPLLSHFE